MTKTIEVIVSPQGHIKLETKGFVGRSCLDASRFLEEALGTKVSDHATAELYQAQSEEQILKQGGSS